jgi:arsenate reductase-like glutaredoxin family protein
MMSLERDTSTTTGYPSSNHNDRKVAVEYDRLDKCVTELREMLNSMGSKVDVLAYMQAIRGGTDVVESEADLRMFLLVENYNIYSAAKRCIAYWNHRMSIFGRQNYTNIISLAGDGAMDVSDIATLEDGTLAVLPDDVHGNILLCIDESRQYQQCSAASRLRSIFYVLSVLAKRKDPNSINSLCLLVLIRPTNFSFGEIVRSLIHLLQYAIPIHVHALHFASLVPEQEKGNFEEKAIPIIQKEIGNWFHDRTHIHICLSQSDLVENLIPFGLLPENLPNTIGGMWDYNEVDLWLKWRSEAERAESKMSPKSRKALLESMLSDGSDSSTSSDTRRTEKLGQSGNLSMGSAQGANETITSFEENSGSVNESNEDIENRSEILRKRNAVYSKRKYYKKKLEVERLEQTRHDLEVGNRTLTRENQRLTSLLVDAQEKVKIHDAIKIMCNSRSSTIQIPPQERIIGTIAGPHSPVASFNLLNNVVASLMSNPLSASVMTTGQQGVNMNSLSSIMHMVRLLQQRQDAEQSIVDQIQLNELQQLAMLQISNLLGVENTGQTQSITQESLLSRGHGSSLLNMNQNLIDRVESSLASSQQQVRHENTSPAVVPTNVLELLAAIPLQRNHLNSVQPDVQPSAARIDHQQQSEALQQNLAPTNILDLLSARLLQNETLRLGQNSIGPTDQNQQQHSQSFQQSIALIEYLLRRRQQEDESR